ncbi:hypothetical protein C8J56DRAFT_1167078 [Mycena floridula]|nr:hypothetical protein C8J56DRAFT_1167078 [Mycena floridula]
MSGQIALPLPRPNVSGDNPPDEMEHAAPIMSPVALPLPCPDAFMPDQAKNPPDNIDVCITLLFYKHVSRAFDGKKPGVTDAIDQGVPLDSPTAALLRTLSLEQVLSSNLSSEQVSANAERVKPLPASKALPLVDVSIEHKLRSLDLEVSSPAPQGANEEKSNIGD